MASRKKAEQGDLFPISANIKLPKAPAEPEQIQAWLSAIVVPITKAATDAISECQPQVRARLAIDLLEVLLGNKNKNNTNIQINTGDKTDKFADLLK
jgi:hypothetical protein